MKKHIGTALLFAFSAALIVTGVLLGDPREVLTKATHVCMECIGIG